VTLESIVGLPIAEIPTPALMIDLDIFEKILATMREACKPCHRPRDAGSRRTDCRYRVGGRLPEPNGFFDHVPATIGCTTHGLFQSGGQLQSGGQRQHAIISGSVTEQ
jgi:hypothetical protein